VAGFINLEHADKSVVFKGDYALTNELVFQMFAGTPATQYDETFERALVLGSYALQLNGTGELLNKVAIDLNGELHKLKVLMDLRGLRQREAAVAGAEAEINVIDALQAYADARAWDDDIAFTGNTVGVIPRRKVGDALVTIKGSERTIVVESKADQSVGLGEPGKVDPTKVKTNFETKTAYGQSLTALANREATIAIFVFFADNAPKAVRDAGTIQFLPEQPGFNVIVDRVAGTWDALNAAYALARGLCLAWDAGAEQWDAVDLIAKRLSREIDRLRSVESQFDTMRKSAMAILAALDAIDETRASMRESLELVGETIEVLMSNPADAAAKRTLFLDGNT
jgi:hypothetical protein